VTPSPNHVARRTRAQARNTQKLVERLMVDLDLERRPDAGVCRERIWEAVQAGIEAQRDDAASPANEKAEAAWARCIPAGLSGIETEACGAQVLVRASGQRVNRQTFNVWLRSGWLGRISDGYWIVLRGAEDES
jgi:hypothetical protein